MPDVQITVDDRALQSACAQFPEEMRAAAESSILEAVGFLEGEVVSRTPVAHGFLAGQIFSELRGGEAEGAIRGIVAVNPPADRYALPVETGRKPGKRPPMEAMLLWLRSSKMAAKVTSFAQEVTARRAAARKQRGRRRYKRSPQEEARRTLGFLIARKIGREGTKGSFMFAKAYWENRDAVLRRIKDGLRAAIERLFGGLGGS